MKTRGTRIARIDSKTRASILSSLKSARTPTFTRGHVAYLFFAAVCQSNSKLTDARIHGDKKISKIGGLMSRPELVISPEMIRIAEETAKAYGVKPNLHP